MSPVLLVKLRGTWEGGARSLSYCAANCVASAFSLETKETGIPAGVTWNETLNQVTWNKQIMGSVPQFRLCELYLITVPSPRAGHCTRTRHNADHSTYLFSSLAFSILRIPSAGMTRVHDHT